jgi:hypothetical protein
VDREAVFDAWAPRDCAWTPWVKPVLFAYVGSVSTEGFALPRPTWIRADLLRVVDTTDRYRASARDGVPAVIVDLPGVEGVAVGLALADLGFRPVPLYTALPAPNAFVPMDDLVRALVAGAPGLVEKALPPNAPPAFLLDARRDGRGTGRGTRWRGSSFDNRSIAFPTDFPSAARLRAGGVGAVVLVQSASDDLYADLVQTLSNWQKASLPAFLLRADAPKLAAPMTVRPPDLFDRVALWLWRKALTVDKSGAFGGRIPHGG